MSSSSQSQPCDAPKSAVPVSCDICSAPFLLAPQLIDHGQILGLLVCSQCVSDELEAQVQ